MKYQFMCAVSAAALSATGAYADKAISPPADWTGPYAGLQAGAGILGGDMRATVQLTTNRRGLSDTNFTFGGVLGRNWQRDAFVFGFETGFNYLGLSDSLFVTNGKNTALVRADYDWFATARVRAGVARGSVLFYATGGLALIDSDLRLTQGGAAPAASGSDSSVLLGYAVGGGVEYAARERWTAKIEYLYTAYGAETIGLSESSASVDPDLHVVRAGVNYRICTSGTC